MPRKSSGDTPTDAERQAPCRAARAAGVPVVHTRQTIDHRSRAQRWRDAAAEVTVLQAQYAAWLEALVCKRAPLPRRCRRSASLSLPIFWPSSPGAGSAETDSLRGGSPNAANL